jgi:hypothetical protein
MKIYRGLKNLLIKHIDPLYRNNSADAWHLTYGPGTSYAFDQKLAESYCLFGNQSNSDSSFGLLLEYEFKAKNMFTINEKHFFDEEDNEAGFFIDNEFVCSKELAKNLSAKGYDSVDFDLLLPGFEHILILENCSEEQFELVSVKLSADENVCLQSLLKSHNYVFDGKFYLVPLNKILETDELLAEFIS